MSYGFSNVNENNKIYLKEAGLHKNAKFLGLTYDATPDFEFFDIEIETEDGRYFRERTFGPDIEKVYPKAIYKSNQKVGEETKQQAFERVTAEINTKLYYLGLCFIDKDTLVGGIQNARTLKEFVAGVNKVIGEEAKGKAITFLTVWKNSDVRQKSNLIIAERIKWCEAYHSDKAATIKLTKWQLENQTVEKYPYKGEASEVANTSAAVVNEDVDTTPGEGLPF